MTTIPKPRIVVLRLERSGSRRVVESSLYSSIWLTIVDLNHRDSALWKATLWQTRIDRSRLSARGSSRTHEFLRNKFVVVVA